MKNLALLLFLTFSLSLTAQNEKLIGKWTGDSKGEVGSIVFDNEGYITFIIEGNPMGGKAFDMDGVTANMTYAVDYSVKPYPVEIDVNVPEVGTVGTMYGFIEFLSDDSIKMAVGQLGEKITAITPQNSIVLTRDQ